MKKYVVFTFTLLFALTVLFENHSAPIVVAHGGQNNECNSALDINPINDNLATYTASAGKIVTGVCIKSGSGMFGDGHSETLGNGSYNGTSGNACYTVSGVGNQTVTVARIASGNSCKAISHIDVYTGNAPTGTPTPTLTPTPTITPTPTVIITPTPTIVITLTATPIPSVTPTVTVTPIISPTITPTPSETPRGGDDPTPTATLTPTPTPGARTDLSDGLSDGKSDGKSVGGTVLGASTAQKQGQVLGASTMAPTGTFAANLATIEVAAGIILATIGFRLNGQKKSQKNK